ncbi:MAG: ribosomal L7Ae/L30e/S12e/Gadd45 family protein [Syntrophomonadaceae bacterium]|jgi:large subunit ribosomal protein L7A|nr:ribosomal L7Ae/L30e/S12e/Gadd45 family protein [Syntrophomonadaceae bacterium]MDH7498230.1 ribosomal L7Ae/L30e/S12e/Gadd45 family protein [Syntrophomonadaceae bacterium]
MSLEALKKAKKVVGTKQVTRAVQQGSVHTVYVAMDADWRVVGPLLELCQLHGVKVERPETMEQLGKACGLQVAAASAGLMKG